MGTLGAQRNNTNNSSSGAVITPRSQQIRRVSRITKDRINSDWQYLEQQNLPHHSTTDQQVNAAYQKQGIQPQGLGTNTATKNPQETTPSQDQRVMVRRTSRTPTRTRAAQRSLRNKAALTKNVALKAKVSAVNVSILAWAAPLWLTVQLPLALISLVALGIWAAFTEAFSAFEADEGAGWAVRGFSWVVSKVADMSVWLTKQAAAGINFLTGIDLNIASMADSIMIGLYMIVFAVGIFSLFIAFMQYSITLNKPLSGNGAGLKIGMFMLAIIGYTMPVANLFPWIFLWMAAVWIYPR